jgi:UDP-N-acetylglucosamine 2-epimerase (non-hydrolysing)
MKTANIVGARPNLVKIAPLLREMRGHPEIRPVLVHTGQHDDEKLSDSFFLQMQIPEPDVGQQTFRCIKGAIVRQVRASLSAGSI